MLGSPLTFIFLQCLHRPDETSKKSVSSEGKNEPSGQHWPCPKAPGKAEFNPNGERAD